MHRRLSEVPENQQNQRKIQILFLRHRNEDLLALSCESVSEEGNKAAH